MIRWVGRQRAPRGCLPWWTARRECPPLPHTVPHISDPHWLSRRARSLGCRRCGPRSMSGRDVGAATAGVSPFPTPALPLQVHVTHVCTRTHMYTYTHAYTCPGTSSDLGDFSTFWSRFFGTFRRWICLPIWGTKFISSHFSQATTRGSSLY